MKQYLLSMYQPTGVVPPAEQLEPVMRELGVLIEDLRSSGAWVFNGGLFPPDTATVVRSRDGDALVTDGPYLEGKEHVGGFLVIRATDLDEALEWGRRVSAATTLPGSDQGLPIEVRPFAGA